MQKEPYTGQERRKTPRKEERLKIEYALGDDLEIKGLRKLRFTHSANIGGGGLCIYVNDNIDFKEGSQLYMIINLPEQKKIFTFVQIVYLNPAEEEGYRYRIGFRYLDIMEGDKKAIMDLLESKQ